MSRMESTTTLVFAATVLPLICTPGPDMLFITSQALAGGARAGLRSTAGVCAGYVVHSVLVALGVAAIVVALPWLFETLRWLGIAYLAYLATRLIRSALRTGTLDAAPAARGGRELRRGFLTAFLNPKGMMIYFAILPQFIHHGGAVAAQALALSAIFVGLCAAFYAMLSVVIARIGRNGSLTDRRRRWIEGISGGLLIVAAERLATR